MSASAPALHPSASTTPGGTPRFPGRVTQGRRVTAAERTASPAAADRLAVAGVMIGAQDAVLGIPGRHASLQLREAPLIDGAEGLYRHR